MSDLVKHYHKTQVEQRLQPKTKPLKPLAEKKGTSQTKFISVSPMFLYAVRHEVHVYPIAKFCQVSQVWTIWISNGPTWESSDPRFFRVR